MRRLLLLSGVLGLACAPTSGSDAGTDGGATECTLDDATAETAVVHSNGCAVRDRDTSACRDARTQAGLSGAWLKFSCRVALSVEATAVRAVADGQPDHLSNYFPATDPCHETYTGATQNPNLIAVKSYSLAFPRTPDANGQAMNAAVVGLALNGVPIYGNFAAPGDDIFREVLTFDRCGGHPQMAGAYHYHGEPYALSFDDGRLIGVLRDGYPVYGRRDRDGTVPTLDIYGGHTGVTEDSGGAPVYHYHLNQQTSSTVGTAGQTQWFLTTGTFRGAPGTCSGCN